MLHAFVLSIGAINALVPVMIIVVLIAAAAGATRGFTLFNVFTISTLLSGTGSVGGGSRGSASRSGYPLRIFLDPGGSGLGRGKERALTTARKRFEGDKNTRKSVIGRVQELAGSSKTAARKKELGIREGERQAELPERERDSDGKDRKRWIRLVTESTPGYRQVGAFGKQKPHPEVVEQRMKIEKEELKKHIEEIKEAGGGDIGARVLVASRLKDIEKLNRQVKERGKDIRAEEKRLREALPPVGSYNRQDEGRSRVQLPMMLGAYAEWAKNKKLNNPREEDLDRFLGEVAPSRNPWPKAVRDYLQEHVREDSQINKWKKELEDNNKEVSTLVGEIAVLQVGERGLQARLRLVEEHIDRVAVANKELGRRRITDKEHRRVFAQSMNRLYGAPDKSIVHNLFNPNYGNSMENIGARVAERGEEIKFAGKVGVYVAASVPAAIAATMETVYKKGFNKSYEPRFETHYTRPKRPPDVLGAIYDVQKKAYENYARSSYDPEAFSKKWIKDINKGNLRAAILRKRKEEGK